MAYDLFSIPAMSAECERVFSYSRKMITDERYSLKVDIIEADQCLKSWLKQQLVHGAATWQILASQIQQAELQEAGQAVCDDIS
jgi:phosphodiesterase/alkaline phosphatase D-like protein